MKTLAEINELLGPEIAEYLRSIIADIKKAVADSDAGLIADANAKAEAAEAKARTDIADAKAKAKADVEAANAERDAAKEALTDMDARSAALAAAAVAVTVKRKALDEQYDLFSSELDGISAEAAKPYEQRAKEAKAKRIAELLAQVEAE